MSVPTPIGPVHFSEPRAARARIKGYDEPHSVVHGDLNIEVNSLKEADVLIRAWRVIMQKAADEAQAILSEMRKLQPQGE